MSALTTMADADVRREMLDSARRADEAIVSFRHLAEERYRRILADYFGPEADYILFEENTDAFDGLRPNGVYSADDTILIDPTEDDEWPDGRSVASDAVCELEVLLDNIIRGRYRGHEVRFYLTPREGGQIVCHECTVTSLYAEMLEHFS